VTVPKRIPYSSNHFIKGQRTHKTSKTRKKRLHEQPNQTRHTGTKGPARWKIGQLFETHQQRFKDEQKKHK